MIALLMVLLTPVAGALVLVAVAVFYAVFW